MNIDKAFRLSVQSAVDLGSTVGPATLEKCAVLVAEAVLSGFLDQCRTFEDVAVAAYHTVGLVHRGEVA